MHILNRKVIIYICSLISVLLIASSICISKYILDEVPPILLSALRMLSAGSLLIFNRNFSFLKQWKIILFSALLEYLFYLSLNLSLFLGAMPGITTVSLQLITPMVFIGSTILFNNPPSKMQTLGIVFIMFGVISVNYIDISSHNTPTNYLVYVFLFIAVISSATWQLTYKKYILDRDMANLSTQFFIAGVLLIFTTFLLEGDKKSFNILYDIKKIKLGLIYLLGLIGTFLPAFIINIVIRKNSLCQIMPFISISPIFVIIFSYIWFDEKFNIYQIYGLIIALIGLITTQKFQKF